MPKLTGAGLVEEFSAVQQWWCQKCEVSQERWSPDMTDMKAKWDPPFCCIRRLILSLLWRLCMSDHGKTRKGVNFSHLINRNRSYGFFLCFGLHFVWCRFCFFFSVSQSEPRHSRNLLSQVHQCDQCLWATRSVCGSLVQPFLMTGN